MRDRNSDTVGRKIVLIAVLIVVGVVGSIVAVRFVELSFMQSADRIATNSGAQPNVPAAANRGFGKGLPPPPFPTGTIIWSLPTPNYRLDRFAPTATFDPSLPTLVPTIEPEYIPLKLPPVDAVAPSGKFQTYSNSNIGFSFDYPSNWHIEEEHGGPDIALVLRNYTQGKLKGDMTTDQIRANIFIGAPEAIENLQVWTGRYRDSGGAESDPDFSITPIEKLEISGVPAVRWTTKMYNIPQGNVIVGFRKHGRMVVFNCYPATSKYMADLNQVIASFRFP